MFCFHEIKPLMPILALLPFSFNYEKPLMAAHLQYRSSPVHQLTTSFPGTVMHSLSFYTNLVTCRCSINFSNSVLLTRNSKQNVSFRPLGICLLLALSIVFFTCSDIFAWAADYKSRLLLWLMELLHYLKYCEQWREWLKWCILSR